MAYTQNKLTGLSVLSILRFIICVYVNKSIKWSLNYNAYWLSGQPWNRQASVTLLFYTPKSKLNGSLTTIFIVVLNDDDDDDVSLTYMYTCTLYPLFYTNFKNKKLVVNQFNAALVYVDSEIYYIAWFSRKGEN